MTSFSIAAKSRKRFLHSLARDGISTAYLLVCTLTLLSGNLVIISYSAEKYAVLGLVKDKCLLNSCDLAPKALICEYSWLMTASPVPGNWF